MKLKFFYLSITIILFTGCNQQHTKKVEPPKQKQTKENPPPKITQTKETVYKYCKKHTQMMDYASNYIIKEFDEGYFTLKDTEGAKAQIFLIESNSPTIYAQNINAALKSYKAQFDLAQKNKCDITNYSITPLLKIKERIKKLENQKEETQK